jgi:hypothetical protein
MKYPIKQKTIVIAEENQINIGLLAALIVIPTRFVEEPTVGFAIIPLVGVDLLNGILGMATGGDTVRKIGAVMNRSRGQIRGEDKPVIGVNGGVLLQSVMRSIVLASPVRIQIP